MPARERALFEPLLGVDLGAIRIHTGIAAIQTARALNARAYAVGSDIAFGSGQYRPGTDSGRRLLAHELVHTVQQRSGGLIRRDVEPKATPADVDFPATVEEDIGEPAPGEQPFVPPAAPLELHLQVVADIDNELWKIHYKRWGTPPPGQPGYLVITPSRNAYAFAGDHLDTRRAKKFRIGGEYHPGVRLSI